MADYRSTLTGTQMDSALLDMAEHNSEAYAVGERNGIAVASDDVTYHNNARYYAQIASSQIVGDASSAVRWDTDQSEVLTDAQKAQARENINAASDSDVVKITSQTLTSAQQAQARANIAAGGSNRNLLDNPWWGSGEAVNQRNTQSKPSNGSYTIDRWILTSGADANQWAIGANGITFTIASSSIWYTQRTPNPSAWSGKTLTASVLLSDGTIKSGSAAFTYGTAATFYNDSAINLSMNTGGQFVLAIRSTQTIRAVKLELGSVSTLSNDAPPNFAEELAKCQRYFFRVNGGYHPFGVGDATSTTQVRIFVPTPVTMRTEGTHTVTTNGYITIRGRGMTGTAPTNVVWNTVDTNGVSLAFIVTGATTYEVYLGIFAGAGYIDLSADL